MELPSVEVSTDDLLDALADVQRRRLLVALVERDPQDGTPVVVTDSDTDVDSATHLMKMKHIHLPKLVNYGFIEWNRNTHEVTRGAEFDEIGPLLKLLDDHEAELPADWL